MLYFAPVSPVTDMTALIVIPDRVTGALVIVLDRAWSITSTKVNAAGTESPVVMLNVPVAVPIVKVTVVCVSQLEDEVPRTRNVSVGLIVPVAVVKAPPLML